jgi:hypothetical protein
LRISRISKVKSINLEKTDEAESQKAHNDKWASKGIHQMPSTDFVAVRASHFPRKRN